MRRWKIIVLVVLGLIVVIGGWQGIYFLTHSGYSNGTRTGLVRKLSKKGPPGCKYWEGEMALQGARLDEKPFTYSLDDEDDKNPLVVDLQKAERDDARVTLHYRQDRPMWWRLCNPNEYFITRVER